MGAFDGYWIPGGRRVGELYVVASGTQPKKEYQYFDNQSSFEFFEGFEMPDLKAKLAKAECDGNDTIWVPDKYHKDSSGKGLHVWYVRALIKEYDV